MHDFQSRRENGYQWAMVAMFQNFMHLICRDSQPSDAQASQMQPAEIGDLASWMARYCEKNWTVQKMCQACGKSRPTLFREFKKFYGITPVQYLTNQRIRKACALLKESNMPMEAVAAACGFASGTYFSTIFRKNIKSTPLQYRKKGQKSR